MTFIDELRKSAKETGSIACMGLDPVLEALPGDVRRFGGATIYFHKVFELMKKDGVLPGAFKPNLGFYRTHDKPRQGIYTGTGVLEDLTGFLDHFFPDIPWILDAKTGDISKSSANYARACHNWEASATTVSPYMGSDSVLPYTKHTLEDSPMGTYVLCRTSNPGAKDFQSLKVLQEDGTTRPLYMEVAAKIVNWAHEHPGVGAVVGATSLEELTEIAGFFQGKEIPLLIPGVGGQGGKAEDVMKVLRTLDYDLSIVRINSSSGLTHSWVKKKLPTPKNFAEVVVQNLENLNEAIGYMP